MIHQNLGPASIRDSLPFLDKNWCKVLYRSNQQLAVKHVTARNRVCKGVSMENILLVLPGPLFHEADKGPLTPGGYGEALLGLWQHSKFIPSNAGFQAALARTCHKDISLLIQKHYLITTTGHTLRGHPCYPESTAQAACLSVQNQKPPAEWKNAADPKETRGGKW